MAKYILSTSTNVYKLPCTPMPGDTPVIVLPEADWRELVDAVNACGGKGSGPVDRIHAIIQRTEAENG